MATSQPPTTEDRQPASTRIRNPIRLVRLAATITCLIVAWLVIVPWLVVFTPNWLIHDATLFYLWALLGAYAVAVPVFVGGWLWSVIAMLRGWRRDDRPGVRRAARWALLTTSGLAGVLAMEMSSTLLLGWLHRIPALPSSFPGAHAAATSEARRGDSASASPPGAPLQDQNPFAGPDPVLSRGDDIDLVLVGESSAKGVPYDPWVSVGQIVAWKLEDVFPGRKIRVDFKAEGGVCLEIAINLLKDLKRRPSALIVFAGHNEFQARYGWSRNVRHYVEEGPESPLALLELARSVSTTAKLILVQLDRFYGETPPPRRATRELVDHPTCLPKEYAFLREDFERRLEILADYCDQIGSLLVLIVPGSNDGGFEPSRSYLAGSTPAEKRSDFAREFQRARAAESGDATASAASYRTLAEQHPEFAETHYRLAQQLTRLGEWEEARRQFILARDLDGLPLRCPSDFQMTFRAVARRRGSVLIDGPAVLARASPHGILDEHLFHDAQHTNLTGTIALAEEVLSQLQVRRAFGWPEGVTAPRINQKECARRFELDAKKWAEICDRTALFYARTAYSRHDPLERLHRADQYARSAHDLSAGRLIQDAGLPSLAMTNSLLEEIPTRPTRSGSGIAGSQ
jgi:hypothetical protein